MKYATIKAHQTCFSVTLRCRALEVSRSGFYAALRRAKSARTKRDEELRAQASYDPFARAGLSVIHHRAVAAVEQNYRVRPRNIQVAAASRSVSSNG